MIGSKSWIVRASIVLLLGIALFVWSIGQKAQYFDFLTASSRVEYRFGPFEWRCEERPSDATPWARAQLADPDRRRWVRGSLESIGLLGCWACGSPFNAVGAIWRLEIPDDEKRSLLRDWHEAVDAAPDWLALGSVGSEWRQRLEPMKGAER